MQKTKNRQIPLRSLLIILMFVAALIAIITRLFYLQVLSFDEYQEKVIDNIQRETYVKADRGIIYDRTGTIQLATNYTVYRVFISPRDIEDQSQAILISTKLSQILGVEYDTIYQKTQKTKRLDETIKKKVDEESAEEVREFIAEYGLSKQIYLEPSTARYYPYGTLASHVLGVVGTDGGLIGLEKQYDSYLSGTDGKFIVSKNALGLAMQSKYDTYVDAQNGANVLSTLDFKIQSILEEQIEQTYYDSVAMNRVTGVAMDVNNGAVLGMATYPNFDLNDAYTLDPESQAALDAFIGTDEEHNTEYVELLYSMWRNKAVSELYEPGSTFKVVTTSMVFEENVVKESDPFYCSGSYRVEGYSSPIHCHRVYGHGAVTYEVGLQQSCNPTLMAVAERLGRAKFYEYFKLFGYTEKTGVDLPGEASPIFHQYGSFNQVELAVYSFGQTFKTTAIQQLTAIATVANGGYLVQPHLVSEIVDDDGNILYSFDDASKRQVVSESVCNRITKILEEGVSGDGGAKNAYVAGYKVAAKTGTSEVRDVLNEEGKSYLRVGSCVAYAPADDPQIAVIIIVDQPMGDSVYGSVVAAPYVANFLEEALPYLGVEREYTEEELAKLAVTIRDYEGWPLEDAMLDVTNRGVDYIVEGDGDIVTHQIPEGGSSLSKDTGKVIFYTGDAEPDALFEVPKVTGMSASMANRTLTNSNFNVLIDGATNGISDAGAIVVSQEPEYGEKVPYGTVVRITLRYLNVTDD